LAAAHENIVYLCGVTADPAHLGHIKGQTKQVLERIDRLLSKAGTDKSKLLSAQIWLTDMAHFEEHNATWNAWVDPKNPPVRACLLSPQLWQPGLLVEIEPQSAGVFRRVHSAIHGHGQGSLLRPYRRPAFAGGLLVTATK
jgi:enamine deaminase RidA (YjgF/YER057c/UK114 family)